jgi:hypothetical protein
MSSLIGKVVIYNGVMKMEVSQGDVIAAVYLVVVTGLLGALIEIAMAIFALQTR